MKNFSLLLLVGLVVMALSHFTSGGKPKIRFYTFSPQLIEYPFVISLRLMDLPPKSPTTIKTRIRYNLT